MIKTDIKAILGYNAPTLRQKGFQAIGIFGSVARGEEQNESDIDILYDFGAKRASLDAVLDLQELLEAHFKRPIHLVSARYLHPLLKADILKETEWVW